MPDWKYKAFISYSHADEKSARWLHKKLEAFRLPRNRAILQVGRKNNLGRVFRDQDELAASSDLGEKISLALGESENLIVICSPHAAQSRWVNEEVSRYQRLGRQHRIFCLVVDRAPNSDIRACFPPALRDENQEPLAADLTAPSGRRVAFLRLVAGLIDTDYDDLRQREAHARTRRLTIVAGASAIGMILAFTLAGFALYSQQEALAAREDADRRREQAEDLITFMLGDLRERLEPIGRLEILNVVAEKSMGFFASLANEDMTDAVLSSRVTALRQIGEVRFQQGKLSDALPAFKQSWQMALRLSEQYPERDDYLFDVGQGHFWIGYVEYSRSRIAEARKHFQAYLAVANELVSRDADNRSYWLEVAYARSNLGTIAMSQNEAQDAGNHFREAVRIHEFLLNDTPDDFDLRFDLAEGYSWLGAVEAHVGRIPEAITWFKQEVAMHNELASLFDDTKFAFQLAQARQLLGYQLRLAGRTEEAVEQINESLEICTDLVAHDPENTHWRRALYVAHMDLGRVDLDVDRYHEARPHVDAALVGLRVLVATDPTNMGWQRDLATAELQAARIAASQGDVDAALGALDAALTRVGQLLTTDSRDVFSLWLRASLLLDKGDVLQQFGRVREAQSPWSLAITQIDTAFDDIDDPTLLATLSGLLHRTGDHETEGQLRARLVAKGYAGPDSAGLAHVTPAP